MSEIRMATITMVCGEFIAPAWREPGTVLQVEQQIADRWVRHGSAVLGGSLEDAEQATPRTGEELGEFESFPGSAQFAAAGVTSLDAVKSLIAKHGDAWTKQIKGMTKAIASSVSEALEAAQNH